MQKLITQDGMSHGQERQLAPALGARASRLQLNRRAPARRVKGPKARNLIALGVSPGTMQPLNYSADPRWVGVLFFKSRAQHD